MRGTALGLALLALAALPLAASAPMMLGSWGAGEGAYGHHSNSGDFVCPFAAVAFTHQVVGQYLTFRAGGAQQTFGQAVPDFVDHTMPCSLGTSVAFGPADFTGSPDAGYEAWRQTDYGPLAGVTTEWLHIGPFAGEPVHVSFHAQTVGGPAPSAWWAEADMVQTAAT